MTEKLLQYLWNHKNFNHFDFNDMEGNLIEVLDFGKWNTNSGPDFLSAKIKINNVTFVGNIELHIKSSDWIFHHHSDDPNYQNIILHVVFENDIEIPELKNKNIPTLELKNHINQKEYWKYENRIRENLFISCESIFESDKIPFEFHEQNILQKLSEKSSELHQSWKQFENNFEAVLFHSLAYSFGLKINASIFKQIAESIDFRIITKIRQNQTQLEALLFGISGWLDQPSDPQMIIWKREFDFVKAKFGISDLCFRPKFLRLRPQNFPTIRLSQLAHLYSQHQNLFSKIMYAKNTKELVSIFENVKASDYWNTHFTFGKDSSVSYPKVLTKDFIHLVILNTVLPLKYIHHQFHNEKNTEDIMNFYRSIPPEKNSIIDGWKKLGLKAKNALDSQSLIYHYNRSCVEKKCLHCSIGFKLLKGS